MDVKDFEPEGVASSIGGTVMQLIVQTPAGNMVAVGVYDQKLAEDISKYICKQIQGKDPHVSVVQFTLTDFTHNGLISKNHERFEYPQIPIDIVKSAWENITPSK